MHDGQGAGGAIDPDGARGGWLATQRGVVSHGPRLGAAAASYVGQPWWADRWGRALLATVTDGPGGGLPAAADPRRVA